MLERKPRLDHPFTGPHDHCREKIRELEEELAEARARIEGLEVERDHWRRAWYKLCSEVTAVCREPVVATDSKEDDNG